MKSHQRIFAGLIGAAACSGTLAAHDFVGSLLNQTTQTLTVTKGSAGIGFLFTAFLAGILTSLLPCIYPMIPITVGILQGQGATTIWRNFQLAFAYVNGMAIVYAMLGYLCAKSAVLFGSWFSSTWFIIAAVLFFLYLAGSMLGLYNLYIPQALQTRAVRVDGGSVVQCFMLGMVAATVASPCIAPPLAVLIGFVAKQANPLIGFAALYLFALGMGMILLAVGTFSGLINLLPRAGGWLERTKQCMGFVLIGVCVYFVQPLVGIRIASGLYASLVLGMIWFFTYEAYNLYMQQDAVKVARSILVAALLLTLLLGLYFKNIFLYAAALFL
jgi:thiol:disulfide interchange protein DsbD